VDNIRPDNKSKLLDPSLIVAIKNNGISKIFYLLSGKILETKATCIFNQNNFVFINDTIIVNLDNLSNICQKSNIYMITTKFKKLINLEI
jgi:hypothetical protein